MSIPAKTYEIATEQEEQGCFMREDKSEVKGDPSASSALTT